ncbi:MAG: nucleotidyl transferase AbiEii/AbiGii toxin family protein [Haliea sp.]
MTDISLSASGKIDSNAVSLFMTVNRVTTGLNIEYFIAGATARDVVLGACFNLDTGAATRDVDFAFMLESWGQYDQLRGSLFETGKFQADAQVKHRLIYEDTVIVDLLPFGYIEAPPGKISWPPDSAFEMNMHGFREAYQQALAVEIAPEVTVRFASPAGLVLLKLFAWVERRHAAHGKDARDIALLLRRYLDAGNQFRLYENDSDLLDAEDFDYEIASARILGRDIASWLSPDTLSMVRDILAQGLDESDDYPLARALPIDNNKALQLLRSFQQGLMDD